MKFRIAIASVFLFAIARSVCPNTSSQASDSPYDFIVVGSGPGGGPLAVNLVKNGYRVLLMEAGSDYRGPNLTVPGFHPRMVEDENLRWDFYVNHYPESTGLRQGVLYPRSGGLGGCASHNAMIVITPHPEDFDNIAAEVNDDSWTDQNMRQYFTRIENNHYSGNRNEHGYSGWYHTSQVDLANVITPFDPKLISISASPLKSGIPITRDGDVNGYRGQGLEEGFHFTPANIQDGVRIGLTAHLQEAMAIYADKLTVKFESFVTKVILDDENRAIGVEYIEGKSLYKADPRHDKAWKGRSPPESKQVYAKREIILSGGSYNSPQILMHSGIGDPEQLNKHNIPVKMPLKGVGKNLQDRYEVAVVSEWNNFFGLQDCLFLADADKDPCYQRYVNHDNGSYYDLNGPIVGIVKKSVPQLTTPDLYIFAAPQFFEGYYHGFAQKGIDVKNQFSWVILKGHSKNHFGEVTLKSSDPTDTPNINFNYFDSRAGDEDINAVVEAIKFSRNLVRNTGLFSKPTEVLPGPQVQSDEELKDWVRRTAWGHHACCTNKIGSDNDPNAVLDKDFRVRGVKGLRVVDASVFPKIPGFFIQTPIYMISEKASDVIIRESNQCKA